MTATQRLRADYVLPVDGAGTLWANGAVDIDAHGAIVAVGPEADLGAAPDLVLDLGGLLMPGLVNAHAHTPMTLVRSAGDGLPLDRWLQQGVWPREANMNPDDAWWGMTLGSAEMLLAGVTTSCEMYLFEHAVVDAVKASGARVMCCPGVIAALAPDGDVSPRFAEISAFHAEHHDDGSRIRVGYGPHSLYDLDPGQVQELSAQAQADDALVHIHLEETRAERELVIERHGATATQLLADQGALEGKLIAAHGVWLDETDRRLLAEAGAAIAHCPISNLKLGSGVAPLVELLDAGVTVGIGTDGPASNDDLDMWTDLRTAGLLARGINHDPGAIDAQTALSLATRSAARAIGIDDIGELRPGARADIIRIDLDQPAFTPGRPDELMAHLVWAGSAQYVTDVWVDGQRVVADGQCETVDVDRAIAEARTRGRRLAG